MVTTIAILLFLLLISFGIGMTFYAKKNFERVAVINSKKEKQLKSDIKMMQDIIKSIPDYLLPPNLRMAIGKVWQDRIVKLSQIIGKDDKGVVKYGKQADLYMQKALNKERGEPISIATQEEADAIITKLKSLYSVVSRLQRMDRITSDIADKFNSAIHQAATRVNVELLQNQTSEAIENNNPQVAIDNLNKIIGELKEYGKIPHHPYRQILKDSTNSINRLKHEMKLQNMLENKSIDYSQNQDEFTQNPASAELETNYVKTRLATVAQELAKQAALQNPDADKNIVKANKIEKN